MTAKILLVDDNCDVRAVLKGYLTRAGYEVITAEDGREAVSRFAAEKPDLVVTDVLMPVMDGFQAAGEMRRHHGTVHVPIIFVSAAYSDIASRIRGLEVGGSDYLTLPVKEEIFIYRVRALLRGKQIYQDLLDSREALRLSEARFRNFFENDPDYSYMVSPEGLIIDANKAALAVTGYCKEDLVGKPLEVIYAPESLPKMKRLLAKWKKTGSLKNEEMVIITGKGQRRTVLLSASGIRGDDGKIIHSVSVQRDITERKKAQEALREMEERFRMVLESSPDLLSMSDLDGEVFWANPAWRDALGYTPETIGDPLEKIHPADRTKFLNSWKSLKDEGAGTDILRYRHRTAKGGWVNLESTVTRLIVEGKPLIFVSSHDITELVALRRRVGVREMIPGIISRDAGMSDIFESIRELSKVDVPVLIMGESGTGKELVASAIHREGPRAGRNFVPVNCGALPDGLLESELFGHVRGAFTGAVRDKRGRFELADGGTIFLDEVGDLSPAMQVKLLRVLQEGTFEKVGGEKTIHVDVRVISATNKDIHREVKKGRFREDLFYRLSVVPLTLPPLRERLLDIPLLAGHILDSHASGTDRRKDRARARKKVTLSPEVLSLMMRYPWPGNVRELQNILQYALIKCKGDVISPEHLPPALVHHAGAAAPSRERKVKVTRESVVKALAESGGNRARAARLLGVSRATLYRFIEKHPEAAGKSSRR